MLPKTWLTLPTVYSCMQPLTWPCYCLPRWQIEKSWMGRYLTRMRCACRHSLSVRESLARNTRTLLTTSVTEVLCTQTPGTLSAVSICGSMLWTCSRATLTPWAPWQPPACCHLLSSSPSCCRTGPRGSWGHLYHLRTWWGSCPRACWRLSGQLNKVGRCLRTPSSSARRCQSSCTSFVFWRRCRALQSRTTSRRKPFIGGFNVFHSFGNSLSWVRNMAPLTF